MEKIAWSSKIRQSKIWQLYQNDALGAVDEVLVEDVGLGLLERCRSIWLVTNRQAECPRCGAMLTLVSQAHGKCCQVCRPAQPRAVAGKRRRNNGMLHGNIVSCSVQRQCRQSKPTWMNIHGHERLGNG